MEATAEAAEGAACMAQSDCSMVARGFSLRSESDAEKRDRAAGCKSLAAAAMLELYSSWGEGSSASGERELRPVERSETKDQNREVSNSAIAYAARCQMHWPQLLAL